MFRILGIDLLTRTSNTDPFDSMIGNEWRDSLKFKCFRTMIANRSLAFKKQPMRSEIRCQYNQLFDLQVHCWHRQILTILWSDFSLHCFSICYLRKYLKKSHCILFNLSASVNILNNNLYLLGVDRLNRTEGSDGVGILDLCLWTSQHEVGNLALTVWNNKE